MGTREGAPGCADMSRPPRYPRSKSRFRAPDGTIKLGSLPGPTPPTHALLCRRMNGKGWFLSKAYESHDAVKNAISEVTGEAIADDLLIVEREPGGGGSRQ